MVTTHNILRCIAVILLSTNIIITETRTVSEYTITPSSQLAYYHYPAPNRVQSSTNQASSPALYTQRYAPRLQQHAAVSTQQRLQQFQPIIQPAQQTRHLQQPQQTQQRFVQQPQGQQQHYHHHHQQQQQTQPQVAPVARQFKSPALDNVAFTTALTSQGYVFGGGNVNAGTSGAVSQARSSSTAFAATPSNTGSPSLNVKLPVPFGITPLNIAPLPLQAGASYASLPRGVTSYGTTHPLRR